MAKKDKKDKKEKKEKKGKKGKKEKREKEPDVPYAGSDRLKTTLAYLLIGLCLILLVLAIHTIRFYRQTGAMALTGASSTPSLDSLPAGTVPSEGQIWYTMPDGTFVQG